MQTDSESSPTHRQWRRTNEDLNGEEVEEVEDENLHSREDEEGLQKTEEKSSSKEEDKRQELRRRREAKKNANLNGNISSNSSSPASHSRASPPMLSQPTPSLMMLGSAPTPLGTLPSPLVKLGTRLTPNTEGSTRSDEGYHSNGCHDELTPPEDSSDSDSENNYVLDFSVKSGSGSGRLQVDKENERHEVIF